MPYVTSLQLNGIVSMSAFTDRPIRGPGMLAFLAYTHACGDVPLDMVLSKRSRMETMRCCSPRGGRFFRIVLTVGVGASPGAPFGFARYRPRGVCRGVQGIRGCRVGRRGLNGRGRQVWRRLAKKRSATPKIGATLLFPLIPNPPRIAAVPFHPTLPWPAPASVFPPV